MIGASQSALSIQNPSQAGPRTQGDDDGDVQGAAATAVASSARDRTSDIEQVGFHPRLMSHQ